MGSITPIRKNTKSLKMLQFYTRKIVSEILSRDYHKYYTLRTWTTLSAQKLYLMGRKQIYSDLSNKSKYQVYQQHP